MLSSSGLKIVVVFQKAQNTISCFNASEGKTAAQQALKRASDIGQPIGSAIYFAIDFDASKQEIECEIKEYFTSVNEILEGKYKVGDYGSGLACNLLYEAGLCRYRWISESIKFLGTSDVIKNQAYDIWQLTQSNAENVYSVRSNKIGTLEVDYDKLKDELSVGEFHGSSPNRQNVAVCSECHIR